MTASAQRLPDTAWRAPFWSIVGAIVLVVLSMQLLDMGPEVILVAAFVAFLGVTVWCVYSLSHTLRVANPPPRAVALPRTVGADRRVRALRTGILFGRALEGHSDRLRQTLVDLIEDQLIHAHGIDPSTDLDAAASIIGPELTAFVRNPETAASIAGTRELTRIVTLIEQI